MIEDDKYVVKGLPPLGSIPNVSAGKFIYDQLMRNSVDSEALVDASTGNSISYKQLLAKTCSLAESLRRAGYNERTIISMSSENCIEFFIPVLASLYIGATIALVNHNYTELEIGQSLEISKAEILFCSKHIFSRFQNLKKRLSFIKKILIIDGDGSDSIDDFILENLQTTSPLYRFNPVDVDLDNQVAFILYSSGTTGLPKGVMLTHTNVLVTFTHYDDPRLVIQDTVRSALGLLPFFHTYGLFVGLTSIYKAIKIVVIKKFEERLFLSCIEKYKISELALVPPLAVFLAKSPLVDAYDLSSVQSIRCGAAPLSKETEELLKKRLKVDSVRQSYGLTECTLAPLRLPLDEVKHGSSGKVTPNMLCKIRDPETGKSLGANQVGEICLKGPLVMKGYYRNEEATRNTFTSDGWLLTGDLAYYDEEGDFYIVGRLKELIKYKGFQVAPAELEAILLTNPKIKDAGVIGVPSEVAGELPLAFIVPNEESNLTEDGVKQFLSERVSSHKWLRGGVLFISEIPKTPSGKILRKKLHILLKRYFKLKL